MALKRSEKILVGSAMIVGGIAIYMSFGQPQMDAFFASQTQLSELKKTVETLGEQKDAFSSKIALLEKNTAIPPGIEITTYNANNREETIKQLLDHIVGLATDAGNKFISLTPTEAPPILPPPEDPKDKPGDKKDDSKNGAEKAAAAPLLNTFGYELAVRGTYDSIQGFLKSMAEQKALMEIHGIILENEAANAQNAAQDKIIDPQHPIRLTAKLRLAMQPLTP